MRKPREKHHQWIRIENPTGRTRSGFRSTFGKLASNLARHAKEHLVYYLRLNLVSSNLWTSVCCEARKAGGRSNRLDLPLSYYSFITTVVAQRMSSLPSRQLLSYRERVSLEKSNRTAVSWPQASQEASRSLRTRPAGHDTPRLPRHHPPRCCLSRPTKAMHLHANPIPQTQNALGRERKC